MFCAMDHRARWIGKKAATSLNPSQIETTFVQLNEQWPANARPLVQVVEQFPLGEAALLHLLAVSSICATRLTRNPETLLWLAQPEVCLAWRSRAEMLAEVHALTSGSAVDSNFEALRFWKGREMTRVALRELAAVAPLEETTGELSLIGEICLRRVFEFWDAELRQRYGSPKADFAILALGKLGGGELNHSSDVDLLFLYSEEGQLTPHISYHQFFNRLGNRILETFSKPHPAGSLFRADLRLRPEGSAGPLARSLESMENYYAGFGETWERLALIKARHVCGSNELAYEFLRQHQPFIFPKNPTPELLDEIAAIKRRIEREVPPEELDVKLGAGGIREIEFVIQTLQFIHGARYAFLQEQGTLKALRAIAQLELLPASELRALDESYRFLRRIEHRLQIEAERQTHSIPDDPEKRERLARSLGFDSAAALLAELQASNGRVREIFDHLIASGTAAPAVNFEIFADPARASRTLNELAQGSVSFHVAPRTRQIFRKLRPLLLEELTRCADPDATLVAVVRFVEAFGLRSLLFELLATNPKLLELLVRTFDASFFATNVLIRHPHLLEEITRSANLNDRLSLSQHTASLRPTVERGHLDAIRT